MKIKLSITLLIVLWGISAFSQNAGYMGRRLTIGYRNYFFPAFLGPSKNKSYSELSEVTLNSVNCVNIDYAFSDKKALSLSLEQLKTGVEYYYEYANYMYDGQKYKGQPALLTSDNIGIGIKFFHEGSIAPLGKYSKLEFVFLKYNVQYHKDAYYSNDGSGNKVYQGKSLGRYDYSTFAVTYSFGHQRIFLNRFVFDYGMRFGITPYLVKSFALEATDQSGNSPSQSLSGHFQESCELRLLQEQMVNFHIGIGFLAF